jgi:hypothetical protein
VLVSITEAGFRSFSILDRQVDANQVASGSGIRRLPEQIQSDLPRWGHRWSDANRQSLSLDRTDINQLSI